MSRLKSKARARKAPLNRQQHAGRKESEAWLRSPERTTCPTPSKLAYHGRKEAKAALKKFRATGRADRDHFRLRPYRCPCLRWHLGGIHPARAAGTWVEPTA